MLQESLDTEHYIPRKGNFIDAKMAGALIPEFVSRA